MIPLGERHLRHLLTEYLIHYHQERNHQGLNHRIIAAEPAGFNLGEGIVCRRERIGGLRNYYYREAA